ncbi:hypothetical protein O0L34_g4994 [Tuta absoluta]|nr:hypothetical protein O0L34_g17834 [Tuta absoluta]KAJ2946075.1 hypothetical protein O0L34_g4994 [Tuta absoluta]
MSQTTKRTAVKKTKNTVKQPDEDLSKTPINLEVLETSVLMEINKKLDILHKMKEKLDTLSESVEFYAAQYQKMVEFKKEADKKFVHLERKNVNLVKCNKALEERVMYLESKDREKNIEVIGLEKKNDEKLPEIVTKIASKLNLEFDMSTIEEMRRVGPQKQNGQPQPLLITFRSRAMRNKWLMQRKTRIQNEHIYEDGSSNPIYINENLSFAMRNVFRDAKARLKGKFRFVWVQNSKILVRREEGAKIYTLTSERDIDQLLFHTVSEPTEQSDHEESSQHSDGD